MFAAEMCIGGTMLNAADSPAFRQPKLSEGMAKLAHEGLDLDALVLRRPTCHRVGLLFRGLQAKTGGLGRNENMMHRHSILAGKCYRDSLGGLAKPLDIHLDSMWQQSMASSIGSLSCVRR
jgi:hypothetical protein